MGILSKSGAGHSGLHRLPSGAFTVDARGNVVSSTVGQWVGEAMLIEIGRQIQAVFKGAAEARLPLAELRVQYRCMKITARALRGGAIIFLSPKPKAQVLPPV